MKDIIKQIAQKNGVSTKEVEREMRFAIREGMKNRNNNEVSKAFWDSISPNGEEPTIKQFIMACAGKIAVH